MKLKNSKKFLIIIFLVIINLLFCINVFAKESETEKETNTPEIDSKAAFLMETESENVLYEKNAEQKMYPASTTKIVTAILAIENCKLSDKASVSQNAIDSVPEGYTTAKLISGEVVTVEDLLYGLMLSSGNEAAIALAEHISGSVEEFAELMNKKVKELGCTNTHFVNPNGIHNDDHYTTAKDLAIITKYCMQNETFRKIVSTKNYTLPSTNLYPNADRVLTNTNSLIMEDSPYYYKYAIGVKTGNTTEAGHCLISYSNKNEIELICVTLNSSYTSKRFNDHKTLLEYGYNNFATKSIIKLNTVIKEVTVPNATKESQNLKIIAKKSIFDYLPVDTTIDESNTDISINENLQAPINAGDVLGKVSYHINDKTYTAELVAGSNVYEKHNYSIIILIAGVVLLIASILIIPKKNKNNRR